MSRLLSRFTEKIKGVSKTLEIMNPYTNDIIYKVPISNYDERVEILNSFIKRHKSGNQNFEKRLELLEEILLNIVKVNHKFNKRINLNI